MPRAVGVYAGAALADYAFGHGHPFGPDRFHAFWDRLQASPLAAEVLALPPLAASEEALLRFHTPAYLAHLKACSERGTGSLDGGDTPVFPGIWEAARQVAGSVLDALQRIVDGRLERAFVPIAGLHHARRERAAGFCAVNDCGIAIETLRQVHGIRRVAYVDMDAHHGDGVFYAFESDPECFIADLHEDGRFLYPGSGALEETGRGVALGTKLNLPLPPGADDALFEQAWYRVETFLARCEPEFILFQCGADCLAGDPITHLACTPAVHARATRALCQAADTHCGGRLLALGGGGYDRDNLAAAWLEVVRELLAP